MRAISTLLLLDMHRKKLAFRAAFLIYLAVLVFGSIPGARADIGNYASSLVLHLFTYGLITFLLFIGSEGHARARMIKSFLIVAAMGALDEYVQTFFPYRSANVSDWMVDLIAGLFVSTIMCVIFPKAGIAKTEERSGRLK